MPGEARDVCMQTPNGTSDARDISRLLNVLRSLYPIMLPVAKDALGALQLQQIGAGNQMATLLLWVLFSQPGLARPLALHSSASALR